MCKIVTVNEQWGSLPNYCIKVLVCNSLIRAKGLCKSFRARDSDGATYLLWKGKCKQRKCSTTTTTTTTTHTQIEMIIVDKPETLMENDACLFKNQLLPPRWRLGIVMVHPHYVHWQNILAIFTPVLVTNKKCDWCQFQ